jgi:hypothetical protein
MWMKKGLFLGVEEVSSAQLGRSSGQRFGLGSQPPDDDGEPSCRAGRNPERQQPPP